MSTHMSIPVRQVIAQAFSRTPIQTNPIALAEEVYSWPQLFLYSNSDTLIPASVSSLRLLSYTLAAMAMSLRSTSRTEERFEFG